LLSRSGKKIRGDGKNENRRELKRQEKRQRRSKGRKRGVGRMTHEKKGDGKRGQMERG